MIRTSCDRTSEVGRRVAKLVRSWATVDQPSISPTDSHDSESNVPALVLAPSQQTQSNITSATL